MDYMWIFPTLLTAVGLIWAAILTQNYQKGMVEDQAKITELNEAINKSVDRIEGLNEQIKRTTNTTNALAQRTSDISEGISEAQTELKSLSTQNKGLIQKNLGLSQSIEKTVESVEKLNSDISKLQIESQNYLTGGNMYLSVFFGIDDSGDLTMWGNVKSLDGKRYSMRNVRVTVIDQKLAEIMAKRKEPPRDKFKYPEGMDFKVLQNKPELVELELGDIAWHGGSFPFLKFNWENYKDDVAHFVIVIKADNFWTIEEYLAIDFSKGEQLYYQEIKISRGIRKGEELNKRVHKNFPLTKDQSPNFEEIAKRTGYKVYER